MTAIQPLERIRGCRTLAEATRSAEAEAPFATFWQPGEPEEIECFTFRQFFDLSSRYASLLQSKGLRTGETVVLILPQGGDLIAAFMGAILLGAVPTILAYPNFKVDPEKYRSGLAGVTANIRAKLTIVDHRFPEGLLEHISSWDSDRIVAVSRGDLPGSGMGFSSTAGPEDVALIQHSAGTTGLQKGVALTHRVILDQLLSLAESLELDEHDRVVSWLPLYHDMGLVACFLLPLVAGIPVVMESPVDWVMQPASFLRLVSDFRATLAWLPNFAFQFMARRIEAEDRSRTDLSTMKALVNCSEPINRQSMKEFEDAFRLSGLNPTALQTSYAMAETTFAVTQSRLRDRPLVLWADRVRLLESGLVLEVGADRPEAFPFVSSGRCLPGSSVQVVDEYGNTLPEGTVGELVVTSKSLFEGYFNRPDLTKKVLRESQYWTGDAGFLFKDEVFVIGRRDDTIIIGGRNIYPQDLEEIAFQHPSIRDGRAVAFGVYNPQLGTQDVFVVAEVNAASDLSRSEQISSEIRQEIWLQLSIAPRHVEVVEPHWLIKSTAGKPARSLNRERFLSLRPEIARRYPSEC